MRESNGTSPQWYKCNNDLSQTENRNIAVKWEASVFISRICGLKSVLKTKKLIKLN